MKKYIIEQLRKLNRSFQHVVKKSLGIQQSMTLSKETVSQILANKWQRIFYKKKYNTEELMSKLKEMGLHEGCCVFIQCSWNSFFNYQGNPKEFIDAVLKVIGPNGTLAMPAFPLQTDKPINLKRSPTGAGLLAETFRRYPGVKRSINTQHSACALGPLSDFLLSEHHLSDTCWDKKSPYWKLAEVNAVLLCLGVGYSYLTTSVHCVESIHNGTIPYYTDFFSKEKRTHYYIDYDGVQKEYQCYDLVAKRYFTAIPKKWYLYRYFSRDEYKMGRISNLTILSYPAEKFIPRLVELGKYGIDVYSSPSKRGYKFAKR